MEAWRDIPGFEGRYQVSDRGRVRNVRTSYVKKSSPDKDGYLCLTLYIGRTPYSRKVHRLVAQAFIPNPADLPEVNHEDGVKHHNHVGNLEWSTRKSNSEHAARNKLMASGDRHGIAKLRAADIPAIRCALDENEPMRAIAARYGVSPSTIFDIAHARTWVTA